MDTMDPDRCALVMVDYQARLLPSISGAHDVVRQAVLLAQAARLLGIRVVGTEQNPQGLGANLDEIREHEKEALAHLQRLESEVKNK